jgi:hypothetical protein
MWSSWPWVRKIALSLRVLHDVAEVRDDQVDTEVLRVREHQPHVDGDRRVAVLVEHHVLADLAEAAKRDDAQLSAAIAGPCSSAGIRAKSCFITSRSEPFRSAAAGWYIGITATPSTHLGWPWICADPLAREPAGHREPAQRRDHARADEFDLPSRKSRQAAISSGCGSRLPGGGTSPRWSRTHPPGSDRCSPGARRGTGPSARRTAGPAHPRAAPGASPMNIRSQGAGRSPGRCGCACGRAGTSDSRRSPHRGRWLARHLVERAQAAGADRCSHASRLRPWRFHAAGRVIAR